jgi:cellulose synthase/poly-beta-1,6-N-acetylglucosamine synthase-like glycosyltransferase
MLVGIFWISVFIVFYAYFGYPISLKIFKEKTVKRSKIFPDITLIITAYNEEKRILQKIENTLKQDYPKDKLQIIIASDGSTDRTHDIVKNYEINGVELFILNKRGGKEKAQKEAVKVARGDIIIFSDVATILEPQGLTEIVSNFADSSIGCASSEDRLIGKDGKPCGEGAYVRYEMWLRRIESSVHTVVGLSGSFFAARKEVCDDFSGDMQSDFRTLLSSIKRGYRGVSDQNALGYYHDIEDGGKEFERKVRTVVRGLTVFFSNLEFLNVYKYGVFSYQYFCHKFLRWLVPFLLISTFLSNFIVVFNGLFYMFIFIGQIVFYGIGFWGITRREEFENNFLKIPTYFMTVNYAIAIAWKRFLSGQRIVMWKPSER